MKNGVFVFLTDEVLNAELPGTTIDVHQIKAAGRGKKNLLYDRSLATDHIEGLLKVVSATERWRSVAETTSYLRDCILHRMMSTNSAYVKTNFTCCYSMMNSCE